MTVTINPSLARGLRKQVVTNLFHDLSAVAVDVGHGLESGRQRTVPVFKRAIKAIRQSHKAQIYHDTLHLDKKRSCYRAIMWLPTRSKKIEIVWVSITARDIANVKYFEMVTISKHGIERMLERLKTTSILEVMEELRPVAMRLVEMDKEETWPDFFEVETDRGTARLAREGQHFVLVTYIRKFK